MWRVVRFSKTIQSSWDFPWYIFISDKNVKLTLETIDEI